MIRFIFAVALLWNDSVEAVSCVGSKTRRDQMSHPCSHLFIFPILRLHQAPLALHQHSE
jgi:hypothetical protein